ncbi:sulfite exporter TauE/SafE family protein [Tateyamaria pelophila]|uniref:sulfite exporter TauE/SafE family protein n=1 Tax=Tateyamaria pelophila TaxID=328415 RepID=UPI001CBFA2B1|nr:sulfite exporter TauE/SafE family protein [Tateyamaria pelophila]
MPDILLTALALPGLWWLCIVSFVAGLVRGFSGFGSGLILLPATVAALGPVAGITVMTVADLSGPLPILRRAIQQVHWPDLARLLGATAVVLPVGVWLLLLIDPFVFRYVLCAVALTTLACLISGVRFKGKLTPPLVLTTGGLAGFLGGVVGVPGPPIITLYLASTLPVAVIRSTILLYLFFYDLLLIGIYAANGRLLIDALWIGVVLALPNIAGNMIGAAIFRPSLEAFYRAVAYVLIAFSALSALPLWD